MLYEYRQWRQEDGDLNAVSLYTQLSTVRVFIKFLERIDAVSDGLSEKIVLPTLNDGQAERESVLTEERAERIFEYLRKFEYASRDHCLLTVCWHCGLRIGEARALDVGDFDADKQRLAVKHRPKGDTSLKNGKNSERFVALSEEVYEVIDAYLEYHHVAVTEESGRQPLFSTEQGRSGLNTLRCAIYRVTQPCLTGDCPIGRQPEECDDRGRSHCPETVSPHDIRRGAITHFLSEDVPEKIVSDRMDVSGDVLEAHYDQRTEERKAEQRRQYLDSL